MEFFESATMCFYGVTNVWLEHLSSTDGAWKPRDLEHVAIAFLFFGGGLVSLDIFLRKSIELIILGWNAHQLGFTARLHHSTPPITCRAQSGYE